MSTDIALLAAFPIILASIGFTVALARSWKLGIATIGVLYATDAISAGLQGVDFGLIILYPQDWVFLCVAAASVMGRRYSGRPAVWLMLALAFVGFGRGVSEFSLKQAGVDLRNTFYFLSALNYLASRPIDSEDAIGFVSKSLRWTALALLLTAVVRWTLVGVGSPLQALWEAVSRTAPLRVVTAAHTLLIWQLVILSLAEGGSSKRLKPANALAIGAAMGAVVLMQHRTVWVTAIVSVIALSFLFGLAMRNIVRRALVPLLAAALVALIVGTVQFSQLSVSLGESVSSAFSEDSTFTWRVEMWQKVLALDTDVRRPYEYVTGQPFGSRYYGVRDQRDEAEADYSPHNFYVQTFARLGLIGVAALIVVYAFALRSAAADRSLTFGRRQALIILLIGQLVYAFSYSPDYMQAVILGSALALPRRLRQPDTELGPRSLPFQRQRQLVSSAVAMKIAPS